MTNALVIFGAIASDDDLLIKVKLEGKPTLTRAQRSVLVACHSHPFPKQEIEFRPILREHSSGVEHPYGD